MHALSDDYRTSVYLKISKAHNKSAFNLADNADVIAVQTSIYPLEYVLQHRW